LRRKVLGLEKCEVETAVLTLFNLLKEQMNDEDLKITYHDIMISEI